MMLMPCGPSAVPTGGAGVAWAAGVWIFTIAASFFFAICFSLSLCEAGYPPRGRSLAGELVRSLRLLPHRVRRTGATATKFLQNCTVYLELGHLAELEFDGGFPAEDVDEHGELRAGDVDVGDRT